MSFLGVNPVACVVTSPGFHILPAVANSRDSPGADNILQATVPETTTNDLKFSRPIPQREIIAAGTEPNWRQDLGRGRAASGVVKSGGCWAAEQEHCCVVLMFR